MRWGQGARQLPGPTVPVVWEQVLPAEPDPVTGKALHPPVKRTTVKVLLVGHLQYEYEDTDRAGGYYDERSILCGFPLGLSVQTGDYVVIGHDPAFNGRWRIRSVIPTPLYLRVRLHEKNTE